MIEIQTERLLTFAEAAAVLPHRPHVSTLYRWRLRGVRGIKLKTVMVGGRRYVSRAALQAFIATVSAAGTPALALIEKSDADRKGAIERAEKELNLAGI